jgi:non-ribosomal peptide synthetase component F
MGVLLNRLTGQGDLTISVPYANRDHPGYQDVVALTAIPLLLRLRVAEAANFGELVDRCSADIHTGIENIVPVSWVYDQLANERDDVPALVSVSLTYQNSLDLRLDLPGLTTTVEDIPNDANRVGPLRFVLVPLPDGLDGRVTYPVDLIDPATVRRWADSYVETLAELCREPDRAYIQGMTSTE